MPWIAMFTSGEGIEYYFRWLAPELYTLAKFLRTKEPIAVYTIRKMKCNCFASLRYGQQGRCKHISMLRHWISQGRPWPEVFQQVGETYGDSEVVPKRRRGPLYPKGRQSLQMHSGVEIHQQGGDDLLADLFAACAQEQTKGD
jgi:hypothetical protein